MSHGPRIGALPCGARGTIADVGGVSVGHCTLAASDVQTGVTVVRPHVGDPFLAKVPAAAVVINGFGKSVGLLQVNELGVLETPVALTNTFSVGIVATAQIRAAVSANPGIARTTTSVNPLVFECSDAYLSDMQALAVTDAHYAAALAAAAPEFARGSVGAGRGMSCFGLKGGIGTASRLASVAAREYVLGALVLANFGKLEDLTIAGRRIGPALARTLASAAPQKDSGSIIVVLATDAPVDHRQLRRIATRAAAGIARTGSFYGHGSGDIALAFSTARTIAYEGPAVHAFETLAEPLLDPLFQAAAEATEQSIVDALFTAETVTGFPRPRATRARRGRAGLGGARDLTPRLVAHCRASFEPEAASDLRRVAAAAQTTVEVDAPVGRGFVVATPQAFDAQRWPRALKEAPPIFVRALFFGTGAHALLDAKPAKGRPDRVAPVLSLIESFREAFPLPGAPHATRGRLAFGSIRLETADTNEGAHGSGADRQPP